MIIFAHLLATAAAVYARGLNSRRYLALCALMPGLVFYEVTMLWFPNSNMHIPYYDDERAITVFFLIVAYGVLFVANAIREINPKDGTPPGRLQSTLWWGLGLPLISILATFGLIWQKHSLIGATTFALERIVSTERTPVDEFIQMMDNVPGLIPFIVIAAFALWVYSLERIRRHYSGGVDGSRVAWQHALVVCIGFLILFGIGIEFLPSWGSILYPAGFVMLSAITLATLRKSTPGRTGLAPMPLVIVGAVTLAIYAYWTSKMLSHLAIKDQVDSHFNTTIISL